MIFNLDSDILTMTEIDIDTIYKALRPVPEFDGNPNVLTRFIKICDQIVAKYLCTQPGNDLNNLCLLNGILNKITGPAARTINSNGIPENWLGIRNALINNFADQRDETALYNDLSLLTQGSSTPQEFYEKCQNLFSIIMTYVTLHESLPTTIEAKRDLYKKLTLQSFVRGLREPLGSRIRCMRPITIEKALEFVQDEINVMYVQQRNESIHVRKSTHAEPLTRKMPPPFMPLPRINSLPHNMYRPMTQTYYQAPPPWRPNFQRPHFQNHPPNQNMPTRTQQIFRAPPPNYNPHSNVFRIQPRNNAGPKPMSGVVPYTPKVLPPSGHDWTKLGNPPPSNYFKSREVHFNDCLAYDTDQDYYPSTFDYQTDYDHNLDYNNPYPYYPDYPNSYSDNYEMPNCSYYVGENSDENNVPADTEPIADCSTVEDFPKGPNSKKPK